MKLCMSLISVQKLAKLWFKSGSHPSSPLLWRYLSTSPASKLTKNESKEVEDIGKMLYKYNLDADAILDNNKWLLSMKSDILLNKLSRISSVKLSPETVGLLKLSVKCLDKINEQWQSDKKITELQNYSKGRLEYLSGLLKCSVKDLVDSIDQHYPILTLDFQRIVRVIKRLIASGVTPEDILKDLWIIRHNEKVIEERLSKLKAEKIAVKTWMLRCPENILNNHLNLEIIDRSILGEHDGVVSYLADRLKCSKEEIIQLGQRNPRLLSVNLPKMKMVLDFLYDNGFTADQIRSTPRVFFQSLETIKQRLKELTALQFHPTNLHILCSTVKEHQNLVSRISKTK
ncbi:hypothetical protein CHUAL_004166 [Chamberlinius hualienensis]